MQVENTKLDGVKLIKPAIFEDFRGLYVETYGSALMSPEPRPSGVSPG